MFGFFALLGAILMFNRPDIFRPIYFMPVAFLAITSPMIFAGQRKRERALLAIIAEEAPELSLKLKNEGIAEL